MRPILVGSSLLLALSLAEAACASAQTPRVLRPREACTTDRPEAVATFEDEALEAAVRAALSVGTEAALTCALLSTLERLDASDAGIVSVVGIQNLAALTDLELGRNAIVDIAPLASLGRLTTLGLFENRITSVVPLGALTNLDDVRLQSNPDLEDITALLRNPGLDAGDRVGLGSTGVFCPDLTELASKLVTVDAIETPELFCRTSTPLPPGPFEYRTYEEPRIRVSVVARGLSHPWGLAFPSAREILVTERPGRLRVIRDGRLESEPISGVPEAVRGQVGVAGLMDVALHPDFAENRLVYLTYSKTLPGGATIALARGRLDGAALRGVRDIFVADPWGRRVDYAGSRVEFAPDGTLYMTVGGAFGTARSLAQDPGRHVGKVLRLRDDGSVPDDNPFVGRPGYAPEVYSLGHRNQQGAAVHPETGVLWASEHAPQGGDEVNVVLAGRNYGWPDVSLAREYVGPRVAEAPWDPDMEEPTIAWLPSIAITGMTFYSGDRFPAWRGNLLVGGMLTGRIRGTGHLERIALNPNGEELRRERLLDELGQRVRDVAEGPDGLLYVVTDDPEDGAVLKIEPLR